MISIPDNPAFFMKKTNELAKEALDAGEMPIAALVVYNNEIISSSYTVDIAEKRRLVHAELLALEKIDKVKPLPGKRSDMSLFVNLEPCFMCPGTAFVFGVGSIFYSLESPVDGSAHFATSYRDQLSGLPGYGNPSIHSGLERDEALKLFEVYSNQANNTGSQQWVQRFLLSLQK